MPADPAGIVALLAVEAARRGDSSQCPRRLASPWRCSQSPSPPWNRPARATCRDGPRGQPNALKSVAHRVHLPGRVGDVVRVEDRRAHITVGVRRGAHHPTDVPAVDEAADRQSARVDAPLRQHHVQGQRVGAQRRGEREVAERV